MMENGRVELHKLHIGNSTLSTIYHRNTITGSYNGVRRSHIDSTHTASTYYCALSEVGIYLLRSRIKDICSVALYVVHVTVYLHAQVVLGDNLYGKVVLLDFYVGVVPDSLHQSALYLGTCVVGVVQDAELGVPSLAVEVEVAVLLAVEVNTPFYEFFDLFRRHSNHLTYCLRVADVIAGNHSVLNVLLKVINKEVCHRCNTTLRKRSISLVQ